MGTSRLLGGDPSPSRANGLRSPVLLRQISAHRVRAGRLRRGVRSRAHTRAHARRYSGAHERTVPGSRPNRPRSGTAIPKLKAALGKGGPAGGPLRRDKCIWRTVFPEVSLNPTFRNFALARRHTGGERAFFSFFFLLFPRLFLTAPNRGASPLRSRRW